VRSSVERVVEYLDLPQEPPAIIEGSRPPAYWPSSTAGQPLIRIEDLTIRYAPELPPVLRGVSLELRARERVGLLGRTGSGKSTLAMSVLRFVDPAQGRIVIDGIDISKIGVHDLRSRLVSVFPLGRILVLMSAADVHTSGVSSSRAAWLSEVLMGV
jgi:ABC-type multidrug transport system fused ATPase/permease subunit